MKRAKRFLSILLTLCMVLGMFPGTVFAANSGVPFTDVKEADWFYDAVQYVYENGMMSGTGTSTFSPDTTTTRGMIVTILHRMEGTPSAAGEEFTDVPAGQYYSNAVAWASANGIISGYGNGIFGPNDTITREQMATILYRYAQFKGYETKTTGDISTFADGSQVSSYAVEAMNWAVGSGLISGVGNNTLAPKGSATRAQVAVILMRFCNSVAPVAYTVTFEYNYGNKGVYKTVTVESGKTVDKPANPTRSGYSFVGWYTETDGGEQFDFDTAITEDTTLYAKWSEKSSSGSVVPTPTPVYYTVSFDTNGGSEIATQNVASGSTATEPNAPTKDGYVFDAWYSDVTLTTFYDFTLPVNANITLYAKWKSEAEAYYEANAELIDIINVEDSDAVQSEADVKSFLSSRGFVDYSVTYEYSITGEMHDETFITEDSLDLHPMYQTIYMSENEDIWFIYVINGSIFAYPVSFGLESDLGVELIFSETNTLTSYDNATNRYYVTIPNTSAMIVKTVETINAETLESLTIEEICRLSGATVPATMSEADYSSASPAMFSLGRRNASEAVSPAAVYSSDDPFIVVSLGDSYSSGEGIDDFYGHDLPLKDKVQNYDWLAHRSQRSWPGQVHVPGTETDIVAYRVPYGKRGDGDIQWYFGAVSGAETKNFDYTANDEDTKNGQQKKEYNKKDDGIFGTRYKDTAWLPNQLDIFNYIDDLNDVDYVTMTIGGNDVDFVGVITCCLEPTYLEFGNNLLLENKLNKLWDNIESTMDDIEAVYKKIHDKVPNAAIVVAGYPKLLEKNGKGTIFSKNEATLVNEKVSAFNQKIKNRVESCESEYNTYFVDVETEFDKDGGHQAYSENEWINQIEWIKKEQDLTDGFFGLGLPSAYSIHPNAEGAKAYARCVNAKIEEIEESKKAQKTISGVITIADTDTDMTNNVPLEGAMITIAITGYMDGIVTSNSQGEYTLTNIPTGTFLLTVSKDGYIPVTERIVVTEDDTEIIYNITIEAISEEYEGVGFASGQIFDVGTGRPVSGLTLYIREGLENTTGSVVETVYMNDSVTYSTTVGLEAGNYTIQIVDERTDISEEERYVTSHFNIKILGGMTIDNQNGYVSNGLVSEELRVVLTWGSTPSDLDSHMVGPDGTGGKFHEYYPECNDGSDTDLDVDDTSSYGPETITIYQEHDGTYVYAVHDYTNKSSSSSTALSNSGAQVNVYRGNQLLMTYNVPTNQGGTLWTVFSYDSTTQRITTINEMSYDSSYGDGVLMTAAFSLAGEISTPVQSEPSYDEYIAIIIEDIFSTIKEQK